MTTDRLAEAIDKLEGSKVLAELGAVREAVEELYLLLDHMWRNRAELSDILENFNVSRAPSGRTTDKELDPEVPVYCCTEPKLEWNGDPEAPGVSCANCSFPLVDQGSVMLPDATKEKKPPQKTLF